ncbi:hypothetical protein SKAU_G00115470, partial [Synaphobranchus kaupii]
MQERQSAAHAEQMEALRAQANLQTQALLQLAAAGESRGRQSVASPEFHIPKMTADDDAQAFLEAFEVAAGACRWPLEEWSVHLLPLLSGEAQKAAYSLPAAARADFRNLKKAVLDRTGFSPEDHRRRFRETSLTEEDRPFAYAQRLTDMARRWLRPEIRSAAGIVEQVVLERFIAGLPADTASWVQCHQPTNLDNAVTLAEDHLVGPPTSAPDPDGAYRIPELHFCTPLSSSMMQAGVCLRQDAETTLPELTEQHRIRQKEEELSGLESVHMAESETECAAPGLNTLEPECVTAHSGVSDVHHTHTSLIKIETDMGSTHTGDLIKTECLDRTEPGYVTHLHPDQIKTEANDGGYLKAEHISDLQDIKCADIKSDKMKCESSEGLVRDVMNSVMNGAGVDHEDQTEPWQCAGEPNQNCKKEEMHDLPTQYWDLNNHCDINNEIRIVKKSTNSSNKHLSDQRTNMIIEPMIINSSKNPSLLNFFRNERIHRNKGQINTVDNTKSDLSTLRNHTGENLYKCTHCEKCFSRKRDLNVHLRIHTGEKPYKCTHCGKSFCSASVLNVHQRIHTGEKPYKCTQCEKCFITKSCLNSHLRIHTDEKPHNCTQCEKCFKTKSDLKMHFRIHTGEKPYKCTHCGKSFYSASVLNRHQIIHTGEKPYKCTQCEKCFINKSCLNSHLRIHTDEKPHNCTQCEKCFKTKSDLKMHFRIHTGEKPYKCTQCEKCFTNLSHLNVHFRIHTGEKPYKCTQCEKCFNVKSAL